MRIAVSTGNADVVHDRRQPAVQEVYVQQVHEIDDPDEDRPAPAIPFEQLVQKCVTRRVFVDAGRHLAGNLRLRRNSRQIPGNARLSPPRTSRNRIDSGSHTRAAPAMRIGPIATDDEHGLPAESRNQARRDQPPRRPPSEKPHIIIITPVARVRRGMYSDVSAIAFGMAPPIPIPVRTRRMLSVSTDRAVAVSSDPIPNVSADRTRTGLRRTDRQRDRRSARPASSRRGHWRRPTRGPPAESCRSVDQRGGDVAHGLRVEPVDEDDERADKGDENW
jgi:hypothetical protein